MTVLSVTACQTATPAPTSTAPPPSLTPSPTFDFPTPRPSQTATLPATPTSSLPAIEEFGEPIYDSDFTTGSGWNLGSDVFGATSVIGGSLSLVVSQPNSLRLAISPAAPVANFYAEVVMRSPVCDGEDEFGLVFRHQPEGNHYRVTLTCQGGIRIRRALGNSSRGLVPFLENSPVVFAGPLAENKLAVLASGRAFQIFVNDVEVLTARDAEFPVGRVGVVAESDVAGQTTVTFERIAIYELQDFEREIPTPSPTASG